MVHPRLSLNQATIKYASLAEALSLTADAGYESIGLWREPVAAIGLDESVRLVREHGLRVSTLCRGGFFTAPDGLERDRALDDNRAALDEAAALGCRSLVLVAGGLPPGSRDLAGARARVADAIEALVPHALEVGVTLAIEPLHPMYAADRAVVNTLGQALDIASAFPVEAVGVVVDTFHIWWDPQVFEQIARAGAEGRISSYQVCDWVTPLPADVLLARAYPGDGHIDFGSLTLAVEQTGYTGDIEVEIFNQAIWDADFASVVKRTAESFDESVVPHLAAPVAS
jgi:sugar phosphate isomerase/epimerase